MKIILSIIKWGLRIFIAYHLFQTCYVKLSSSQGAVNIFTMLDMEPWGRVLMGIVELITALLVLYPRTTAVGALLGTGSMGVVIFYHITKLGIAINGDTSLFTLAFWVCMASMALIIFELMNYVYLIFIDTE